jgi:putative Holliday junction resolvase
VRVLALDHGSARCGVAVSDPSGSIATPLDVVQRPDSRRGMAAIAALVAELQVVRVVVGLPLSLSGADSQQTLDARGFAARLQRRIAPTPVELYDERFTTRMANTLGGDGAEDSRAAAHLLTGWLAAAQREPADPRAPNRPDGVRTGR